MLLTAIISETTKSTSSNLLPIIIPSSINIIGFLVTIYWNKKNLSNEINKKKLDVSLSSLSDMPYKCLKLFDTVSKNKKDSEKNFAEIAYKILAYGSKDAIKILSECQQENYKMNISKASSNEKYKIMLFYIILACQIKADLTGIEISPDFFLKTKLSDYEKNKITFKKINNQIVNSLELNKFLIIK